MREFFDLANNPLFIKHLRSRLRKPAVFTGMFIVGVICLLILWLDFQTRQQAPQDTHVGSQWIFWLQCVILFFIGGSQVASAVSQMKGSGIIDFHRITPIPPAVQTVGIILGAPIRELVLYAVTLPFGIYLAATGSIGFGNYGRLLLVQLASALMWYSFAMVIGLTTSKARGASGLFVFVLGLVNVLAFSLFEARVYGPTLVTTTPVYREVFVSDQARAQQQQPGGPAGRGQPQPQRPPRPDVTFYGQPFPLVVQSLLFQAAFLVFFFIAASRRFHSTRLPLYTKPTALIFLFTLSVLTLGSLWDSPTVGLTLGLAYFLATAGILLTNTITPPLGEIIKGMQRARKLSRLRVPLWSDLASNRIVVLAFAVVMAGTIAAGLLMAPQPPLANAGARDLFSPWPSVVVALLSLLTYGFAKQYFSVAFGRSSTIYFGLFLFIAWLAPFLIGMIVGLANIKEGVYVSAISPIVGIAFAGLFEVPNLDGTAIQIIAIASGAIFTAIFLALLLVSERKLLQDVVEEHHERRDEKEPVKVLPDNRGQTGFMRK